MSTPSADRLLPPQASPLERAIAQTGPTWEAFAGLGANLETERPPAFAPWLAAEWHLAQFAGLFPSTAALIDAGLPWLFERGSAASVRRVLGWLGYAAGVALEEDEAYLHIDLGRTASPDDIQRIAQVVRASLPAHMRLYRLFFAYDLRPVRLDRGPALDAGLLDDDSGVWIGDVKASFGDHRTGLVEAPAAAAIASAHTARRASLLTYDDRLLLDAWRLDSHLLVDAYGGLCELYTSTCSRPEPGHPERASGEGRTAEAAWSTATPVSSATQTHAAHLPVAVLPARPWSGPWSGPWRPFIPSKRTEET